MKILFVAMPDSIHVARWIAQIQQPDWEMHVFPSIDYGSINPELKNVTVHHSIYAPQPEVDPSITTKGIAIKWPLLGHRYYTYRQHLAYLSRLYLQGTHPHYRVRTLARLIQKLKPDIIHSMEFQHGGYLTSEARDIVGGGNFPKWIATNWGNDIYLYGQLKDHQPKIKKLLANCDYYSCECERDVKMAEEMGLRGKVLPVMPNSGSFDLEHVHTLRQPGAVSERRVIMVKGYQNFAGRALFTLKALEMCQDVIKDNGYCVKIFSAFPDVKIAAEVLANRTGIDVEIAPKMTHNEMLSLYGSARVYMGMNISDGISTSILEAMIMGTFPMQSYTACADEWFTDGKTGFIIPPEDPYVVAEKLTVALTDDKLVNEAASVNWQRCQERLGHDLARENVRKFYDIVSTGL